MATTNMNKTSAKKMINDLIYQNFMLPRHDQKIHPEFERIDAKNNFSGKQKWNEYSTVDATAQSMIITTEYEFATISQAMAVWKVKLVITAGPFIECNGEGKSASKKFAEQTAFEFLWQAMRVRKALGDLATTSRLAEAMAEVGITTAPRSSPELRETHPFTPWNGIVNPFRGSTIAEPLDPDDPRKLERAGDVEKNPGPIVDTYYFPAEGVRIGRDFETIHITLPNAFKFTIDAENCFIDTRNKRIGVTNIRRGVVAELKKQFVDEVKIKFGGKNEIVAANQNTNQRKQSWSNHEDFVPEKRIKLQLINAIAEMVCTSDPHMLENSEGNIIIDDSFIWIPKNIMGFRFNKKNYSSKDASPDLHRRVLLSVSNQKMTTTDKAKMAIALTQIQMMYFVSNNNKETLAALFYMTMESNLAALNRQRSMDCSRADLWFEIAKCKPVIPTGRVHHDNVRLYLTTCKLQQLSEDKIECEPMFLTSLTERTIQAIKPIDEYTDNKTLIDQYCAGIFALITPNHKFKLETVTKFTPLFVEEEQECSQLQEALAQLVEERLWNNDFPSTIRMWMLTNEEKWPLELTKKIVKFFVDTDLVGFHNPGTHNLFNSQAAKIPKFDAQEIGGQYETIQYINLNLASEKRLANYMQQEYNQLLSKFRVFEKNNRFYNMEKVLQLMRRRRPQPGSTKSNDILMREYVDAAKAPEAEESGWLGYMPKAWQKAKKMFGRLIAMPDMFDDSVQRVEAVVKKAESMFTEYRMPEAAAVFANMDTSTFQGLFSAFKVGINALLKDIINKFLGFFGLADTTSIDATTLLLYYMLWKESDSKVLKMAIIGDLMASLGILDAAWDLLKVIWNAVSGFIGQAMPKAGKRKQKAEPKPSTSSESPSQPFESEQTTDSEEEEEDDDRESPEDKAAAQEAAQKRAERSNRFAEALKALNEKKEIKVAENKVMIKEEMTKVQPQDPVEDVETSWWNKLLLMLTDATPAILGAVGVAVAAYFGIKASSDKNSVGMKIATAMRSISFMGMGLVAIPKIFTTIYGVFTWLKEHVRSVFVDGAATQYQKQRRICDFLASTIYCPLNTPIAFMQDLPQCIRFEERMMEAAVISKDLHEIENHRLVTHFIERLKMMQKLYPKAQAAAIINIGTMEPFHVNLVSKDAGVGKTDVAQYVLKAIQEQMAILDQELAAEFGVPTAGKEQSYLSGIYPMNETLKHCDDYYAQQGIYFDEVGVFRTPDQESIYKRMTLLTGAPMIASMADVNEKGQMLRATFVVSNSNTKYEVPDGMLNPFALNRRRMYIKVNINPEYKKAITTMGGKEQSIINEEVLAKLKLNRSKCEHLTFSWRHAGDGSKYEGFQEMELKDLVVLIRKQLEHHHATEAHRILTRDPTLARHRIMYDTMIKEIRQFYREFNAPKYGSECFKLMHQITMDMVKKTTSEQQAVVDKLKDKVGPADMKERKMYSRNLGYLERLKARLELANTYNFDQFYADPLKVATADVVNGDIPGQKAKANIDEHRWVYMKLRYMDGRVIAVPSEEKIRVSAGMIKFKNFVWENQPAYKLVIGKDEKLTTEQQSRLMFWLIYFSTATSKEEMNKMIDRISVKYIAQGNAVPHQNALKSVWEKTQESIGSIITWIQEGVMKIIGSLATGLLVGVSIIGAFFALGALSNALSTDQVKSYNQRFDRPAGRTKAHDGYLVEHTELVKNVTYQVFVVNSRKESKSGMAIGVQGSNFLINQHTVSHIDKDSYIHIYDHSKGEWDLSGSVHQYPILKSRIQKIPGTDAALVNIKGHRSVRNCLKHFVTEEDLKDDLDNFRHGYYNVISLRTQEGDPNLMNHFEEGKRGFRATGFLEGYKCGKPQFVDHDRNISIYKAQLKAGDSGSLCLHNNPKVQQKFIGILLGGDELSDVIGVITQEQLQAALDKQEPSSRILVIPQEGDRLREGHPLEKVFKCKNELYKSPVGPQGISKETGFTRSPIFGEFPVDSQPAIQDIRDGRIPPGARHFLEVSLNKYAGRHPMHFTEKEETFMTEFLLDTYRTSTPGLSTVRLYSTTEAITGTKIRGSTSLNLKSSMGLPYKLERGVKGKSPFIKRDDKTGTWMIDARVFYDVDYYENEYRAGRVPINLKSEFRKIELVAHDKVINPEKIKTRTVGTGNGILQIVYNKLFKDLYTRVKNTWSCDRTCPFALGIDMERHTPLMIEHLKWIDCVLDFDVKSWEAGVNLRLLLMTAHVKHQLLTEAYAAQGKTLPKGTKAIIDGLAVDYTDTNIIFEDVMHRKTAGLLSGHPGTFTENSEIHLMLFALVSLRILNRRAPEFATIPFIRENIRTLFAADDIIVALSPLARTIVTAEDIVAEYSKLGYELTGSDKGDKITTKPIEQSQFLKHTFRLTDQGWQAVPNLSIIHQLMNWISSESALSKDDQFTVNIQNAFRMAYWHGEEEYERIRAKANRRLIVFNRSWPFDYRSMSHIVEHAVQEAERAACAPYPSVDNTDADFEF